MNEEIIRQAMAEMGRRSAAKLTPEQRVAKARVAASGKWSGTTPERRRELTAALRAGRAAKRETLDKPLTYEEERGKPMPSRNHAAIQVNLIVELTRHREFRVYSELTLEFEGKPFTPDLSVYPREGLDLRHDLIRRTDPPLVVVEILSPSQGYQEVMEKVDVYFRSGVKSCWIVAPPLHTVSILSPSGSTDTFHSGAATDPATGLTVDLEAVFA